LTLLGESNVVAKLIPDRAKEFASHGCIVYATARNTERMQTLHHHPRIELLPIDVTDDHTIKLVVDTIIANEGRIDIVVNNAGTGCYGV
jgi:1-acylglycerone phosphate reductase